ncbi:hypothetical protein [Jatrophihabitans sp.]|jgi:hypothetical protein|uniref:hypothetical protein n=1 Tax=Jatrophihabitans sp. TaxID=1932789 RepID=UPI002F0DE7E2
MDLLSFREAEAPPDLRAQIVALQRVMGPGITRDISRTTHDQIMRPVTMILAVNQVVVASLDVLSKEIVHAGQRYEASGLSWVITAPDSSPSEPGAIARTSSVPGSSSSPAPSTSSGELGACDSTVSYSTKLIAGQREARRESRSSASAS